MMVKKLSFEETSIGGLYKVTPFYADDARGSFIKDYSEEIFLSNGIGYPIREGICPIPRSCTAARRPHRNVRGDAWRMRRT